MTNVSLRAPTSGGGQVYAGGVAYTVAADGSISVPASAVPALLGAGFTYFNQKTERAFFTAPKAADLVSVVAAVAVANGALTLATQPDVPRKLQVRLVRTSGDIATGTVTIVGTNAQGQAVTEVISLITAGASETLSTANAYAQVTSATVASITGTFSFTIGIGRSAALGLPLQPNFEDLTVFKETVASSASDVWTVVDEAVGTVDAVNGTVIPTTAPDGSHHYSFDFTVSH